ncbi:MAG: amidohydrolase [Lachnospiraceae bacterium]|nr:amidohydrolase [Lachnospiraceae bacterium]
MKTRIYNAKILDINETSVDITDGEIQITDDKITYVGEGQEGTFDKEINAEGNLIMPGFKNAHTHSAMTLFRSFADDLPLKSWLYDKIFPLEANLTEDFVYWGSRLAILEYLTSGMTANFDMYMKNDANVKASVDSGFRTVLCGSINNFGGTVDDMEAEYKKYNKEYNPDLSDLISYKYGFHAEYTTGREILEGMAGLAAKYKAPVYTHNSETKNEVQECIGRYNMTPTTFLDSIGMFEYGGGGYHCVYMTDEDIRICKEKKVHIVTNPGSNTKLASGIADICKYMDNGINIAIGTDGPASNNCLDMFREMFLVTGFQKIKLEDASACDAIDVLKMATINGAKAMELFDCETLKAGSKADLIMIDLHSPNMQPLNNIAKNIVYSGSKSNVLMTMVNGKILYNKGEFFVGASTEEIYAKVNEAIKELAKKASL